MLTQHILTWSIAALAVMGVIVRPAQLPEALWAVLGAGALVCFSLMPLAEAIHAALQGTDVYLFLVGMMVLAELARREGLFDWLAHHALRQARGSAPRLFLLIYAVGILVTIFLSNDATAVVLTPAVYAVTQQAEVEPLPYLLVCAIIANAASFVLPISNPANLVVFDGAIPTLETWLTEFGPAAVTAVVTSFVLLYWHQRAHLRQTVRAATASAALSVRGRIVAATIVLTGIVLLSASALGWPLGLATCLCALVAWMAVSALAGSPWTVLRHITWSVLPLVAGLFVLVQGVEDTGVTTPLLRWLSGHASNPTALSALRGGTLVGTLSNLVNNLPMGLLVGQFVQHAAVPVRSSGAWLIGIDLGPNLSVTGSLATILWLVALRRAGLDISAWRFLGVGAVVMPLPLLAALTVFLLHT